MISDSQPFFEKVLNSRNTAIRYNDHTREYNYFFQIFLNDRSIHDFYVVPDGYVDIFVPLDCDDPTSVHGTPKTLVPFELDQGREYFALRLSPLTAYGFLKTPLKDITASHVFLSDVRKDSRLIAEKLGRMDSFYTRVEYMQDRICNSADMNENMLELVNWSINRMKFSNFSSKIGELAHDSGYTERYIRKIFKNYVGLSPKMYSDISRFQQALYAVLNYDYSVQDLIYKFGYYDQAHFINDFKKFAKTTPRDISKYL